jgi:hypothetical protein
MLVREDQEEAGFAWTPASSSLDVETRDVESGSRLHRPTQEDLLIKPDSLLPEDALSYADVPQVLEMTFAYGFGKRRRVVVDTQARTIRFDWCLVGRGFFDVKSLPTVTMPLDDVLEVHECRYRGHISLTVITRAGKALLPAKADNYEPLRDLLCRVSESTPAAPLTQHPATMCFVMGAIVLGMGVGAALTPQDAGTGLLVVAVVSGAAVSAAVALLFVSLAGRHYRGPFAWPLLCGGAGILGGVGMSLFLSVLGPPAFPSVLAWMGIGGLLGLLYGRFHFLRSR